MIVEKQTKTNAKQHERDVAEKRSGLDLPASLRSWARHMARMDTRHLLLLEVHLRAPVEGARRQSSRAAKLGNRAGGGGADLNRPLSKFKQIVVARWFDQLHSRSRQNLEFCYKFQSRRCKDPEGQQFQACAGFNKPH